jgi:uncharacterized protein DUF5132
MARRLTGANRSTPTHFKEGELRMAVMAPYLIGVVTAPLVAKVVKPLVRGAVKASVGLALEVKKAAAEASEEIHGLAAEVSSEKAAGAAMGVDVAAKAGRSRAGGTGLVN